jgi:hypothetical protein
MFEIGVRPIAWTALSAIFSANEKCHPDFYVDLVHQTHIFICITQYCIVIFHSLVI